MEVRKDLLHNGLPKWCDDVPFQIKGNAVKLGHQSFWATLKAHKKGRIYFNFKSRKEPEQSCYIPKSAIKATGIYPRISGKGLRYSESLPEVIKDSRLLWRYGNWWLAIPTVKRLTSSENQARSIVALDPGIRTFISFYSPHYSGKIGEEAHSYLFKYYIALDKLISKRDKCGNKRKKRRFNKAIKRLRQHINNLITEMHWKTANFLCQTFDVILMPTFETSQMVIRSKRKIRSKTVRSMMGFQFYQFTQRLKWIGLKLGKKIVAVTEEYTSKTHPQTGVINSTLGGAKTIKLLDGSADRDIVGAFNILLKSLVGDTPVFITQDM
jgi:putative transposase